jgi:hypothetical protein
MACGYAGAAALAGEDAKYSSTDRATRTQRFEREALAMLRIAHERHFFRDEPHRQHLKTHPDWQRLQTRPEFQALLRELNAERD